MHLLLILAGIGQLALALGSLTIPTVLGWREDTAKLKNLTRQVFWTYAGYTWATNVAFGLGASAGQGDLPALRHQSMAIGRDCTTFSEGMSITR